MEDNPLKKFCPLAIITNSNFNKQTPFCTADECAWWCDWDNCCAMVAIPVEISNRLEEIREAVTR